MSQIMNQTKLTSEIESSSIKDVFSEMNFKFPLSETDLNECVKFIQSAKNERTLNLSNECLERFYESHEPEIVKFTETLDAKNIVTQCSLSESDFKDETRKLETCKTLNLYVTKQYILNELKRIEI